MLKSDLYTWLVPYLEGELDFQRTSILEKRLASDPKLAAEAERLRGHLRLIRAAAASAPKREAEYSVWPKVQAQLRAHPSSNTWSPPFTIVAGAAAALLIGVTVARPWDRPPHGEPPLRVASSRDVVTNGVVDVPNVHDLRDKIHNVINDVIVTKPAPIKTASVETVKSRNSQEDLARPGEFGYVPEMGGSDDPFAAPAPSQTSHYVHHSKPLPEHGDTMMAYAGASNSSDSLRNTPVNVSGDAVSAMRAALDKNGAYGDVDNASAMPAPVGTALQPPAPPAPAALDPQAGRKASPVGGSIGGGAPLLSRGSFGNKMTVTSGAFHTKSMVADPKSPVSDSTKINNLLSEARTAANNQKTGVAMDTWRDALMFELQSPTYGDEAATNQAEAILRTIRQTGNLMPFRAFVEHQVGPTSDELADWRILALLYMQQGLNEQAASVWRYITGTSDATGEDWYQLALVRQRLGDAQGARTAFQSAVGTLPAASAHYQLAQEAASQH